MTPQESNIRQAAERVNDLSIEDAERALTGFDPTTANEDDQIAAIIIAGRFPSLILPPINIDSLWKAARRRYIEEGYPPFLYLAAELDRHIPVRDHRARVKRAIERCEADGPETRFELTGEQLDAATPSQLAAIEQLLRPGVFGESALASQNFNVVAVGGWISVALRRGTHRADFEHLGRRLVNCFRNAPRGSPPHAELLLIVAQECCTEIQTEIGMTALEFCLDVGEKILALDTTRSAEEWSWAIALPLDYAELQLRVLLRYFAALDPEWGGLAHRLHRIMELIRDESPRAALSAEEAVGEAEQLGPVYAGLRHRANERRRNLRFRSTRW